MSFKGESKKGTKCSSDGDTEFDSLSCGLFGGGIVAGTHFISLGLGERIQM